MSTDPSGVVYIFYGSLGFAGSPDSKESVAHVMQAHLDTERYLEACRQKHANFGFTIVREGLYPESYPLYTAFFDPKQPQTEIKIPHNGAGPGVAWVKREELAEGTAELISRFAKQPDEFPWRNKTVLLSGSKVLTLSETVKVLGEVAKVPVQIKQVSEDEFAAQPQVSRNFTYHGVDLSKPWASAFEAFRRGEGAFVSPLLKELLGREPEDFETTIRRSL
ncbi:nmrA-like family protein [Colletotrichum tofieldiae]|nr:nmrA-like family protein [Colletotrichum tofieldiae]